MNILRTRDRGTWLTGDCSLLNSVPPDALVRSLMQLQSKKAIAAGAWILAITAIAMVANLTAPSTLAVVALVALIPPVVLWRFWNVPVQSMSESIRKALR